MRGYLWCTAAKGTGVWAAHERNNPHPGDASNLLGA